LFEKLLAGRWIAGPSIQDGIKIAKKVNANMASAILNYLGEDINDMNDVNATVNLYLKLIDSIKSMKINADISLKPTELGLEIDKEVMKQNYVKIVKYAKKKGIFVWLDMEQAPFVDDTIALYKIGLPYKNVGICIQAYLRRSLSDLRYLSKLNSTVRLVKGAYSESPKIAFPSWADVTANYSSLMEYLFKNFSKFTIATHDNSLIEKALGLNEKYKKEVTYAMLNGIRNKYAYRLAAEGNKVSIYVPFGTAWFKYAFRRLREEGGARRFVSILANFRQN
jgi:proline dehydrogenase